MSEKASKMRWFPVFVCRAIGGNGPQWMPEGGRHEEVRQDPAPAEAIGRILSLSGRARGMVRFRESPVNALWASLTAACTDAK